MSVLVGITSKNRAQILPFAIKSALEQDYPVLKVAVFDDNSSDQTYTLKEQFPMVEWELSPVNRGYLFARNKLMSESSSLYYCSLDDDAWFLTPDTITMATHYFENHPKVAAIAFDILSPDAPDKRKKREPVETSVFIGCGHILRLKAVKEVGYYDTFPYSYGSEEKDLCMKLINAGYQIMFMPGVHVWHDKTNLERDRKFQHLSGVCNDLTFMYRRSPFIFLIPGLLLKIFNHFKFSIFYEKGILFTSCVKGVTRFLILFFSFKMKRRPVTMNAFRKFHKFKGIN